MVKKRFNELAKEKGFEDVASSNDPKHDTIKKYSVYILDEFEVEKNEFTIGNVSDDVDLTLCYVLWDNPLYIKFLYISFLSQLLYTDAISLKNIFIYTDKKLLGLVEEVFEPFLSSPLFNIKVKSVNSERLVYSEVANNFSTPKRLNKYLVSLDEELRETDLLLISDCESFIYGNRIPIYSKIHREYQSSDEFPVLGCEQNTNYSVFLNRREDLAGMMYDDEEYINWVSKRIGVPKHEFRKEIIDRNNWFLTCWFLFDNEKYKINDKNWKDYVNWSRDYGMHCDETIYLTYGISKKDYQVEDLGFVPDLEFIHSHESEDFFDKESHDKLGVVHPLHGSYSSDFWVQKLWNKLQDNFQKKVSR